MNWHKKPEWWQVVAIAATFLVSLYAVLSAEFGPFINKPKINFYPTNKFVGIKHDYGSLRLSFPLDVVKTGRGDMSVSKILIYLHRYDGNYQKLFYWDKSMITFNDYMSYNLDLIFEEETNMDSWRLLGEKIHKVKAKLIDKYRQERMPERAYFVEDDDGLLDLKKYVLKKMEDFIPAKYKMLIMAFEPASEIYPIWKEGYIFDLNENQVNSLKKNQLMSYNSMPEFDPKYQIWYSNAFFSALKSEEVEKLFEIYKNYAQKSL